MTCRSAESLFSSFLEDEVSQEERRVLEAHLMSCRRCSVALREVRATVNLVRALPEVSTGAHFEDDLFAKIRSGEGIRPAWPAFGEALRWLLAPLSLRPVLAVGAAAIAIGIGVLTIHPGRQAPSQSVASAAKSGPGDASRGAMSAPVTVAQGVTPPSASAPAQGNVATRRAPLPAQTEVARAAAPSPDGSVPAEAQGAQGDRLEPQYQDEYILDQFLLERSGDGQNPAVVPVNDTGRDVYITF
jgi:anti-sigma factor RsiW